MTTRAGDIRAFGGDQVAVEQVPGGPRVGGGKDRHDPVDIGGDDLFMGMRPRHRHGRTAGELVAARQTSLICPASFQRTRSPTATGSASIRVSGALKGCSQKVFRLTRGYKNLFFLITTPLLESLELIKAFKGTLPDNTNKKASHEKIPWLAVLFKPGALQVRQNARLIPYSNQGIKKPRGMSHPWPFYSGSSR
jgi:hypothetical protein